MDSFVLLAYASLAASRTLLQQLLKDFLIASYFINSLFKRKRIQKLTQERIKISKKVSYFSLDLS